MRLYPIASGSSGNCIYVGSDTTHLLVDTGLSKKRTEEGLHNIDVSLGDIDGILITHEHSDHIGGLGVISRKYHIPIYGTKKTIDAILNTKSLGALEPELFHPIEPDSAFVLKDIKCNPMRISHDAADPVAYRFKCGNKQIAIATDMGTYNDYTVECLKGMDALLLEANHDIHMLQVGPYPYMLKQRILGDRGHLSNERSGELLSKILHDNLQAIYLGHLSQENNMPELAFEAVKMEINLADNIYKADDFNMMVAKRSKPSELIKVV